MSLNSLFIVPCDPHAAPDLDPVRRLLDDLQVTAGQTGPGVFNAGPAFSRHVVYAGCAPHLVFEPPADGSAHYCHVALHGPFPTPRLVTGPNTVRPRCPACRARFDAWRDALEAWRDTGAPAVCPRCGEAFPATALDWRQHAVAGRVLLEMRNVFPGEAAPSDRLLGGLHDATGLRWCHGWAAAQVAEPA